MRDVITAEKINATPNTEYVIVNVMNCKFCGVVINIKRPIKNIGMITRTRGFFLINSKNDIRIFTDVKKRAFFI